VSNYITQAHLLLVDVNFTGVYTSKNSPGHDPISASQATQMNNLMKLLDSYNNNATSICP
jgi:hypothetical protein